MVPFDVVLGGSRENEVTQSEGRLRRQRARRRGGEAVTEEQDPVRIDEHHARVRAVVASDMEDLNRRTADVELDRVFEDDVGGSDLDDAGRGQLLFDIVGMLRRREAGRNTRGEPCVAPVSRCHLEQLLGGPPVGDHQSAHFGTAEHVIPMRVRVHDRARPRAGLA